MITYFSNKNKFDFLLLFLYALVLKFSFFITPQSPLVNNSDGFLYKYLLVQLAKLGSYQNSVASIIAFILLYTQAVNLSVYISKYKLLQKPNLLAGMCYLLISSLFTNWNMLSSAIIINTIMLQAFIAITQLQQSTKQKTLLFNIGILICLANFFYSFAFVYLLVAVIGLLTYRAFKLNEFVVLFLGFILPFYFLWVYQYLTNSFSFKNSFLQIKFRYPAFYHTQWGLISCVLIIVLLLMGIAKIQQQSAKMNIQSRKSWSIFFFWVVFSLLIPFWSADFRFWILSLLPIAAFIGGAFYFIKNNKYKNILQWAVFGFAIFIQYFLK